ncbi:HD-GYP domain-containing protein [Ningiella sp. W23]|uniref:HD-GYP domain-containing protein n=1 Tax=Ningiella sp. W23 TaxID=3023715 RepID=UPI0039F4AA14
MNELRPGMIVHAISRQSGKLVVKSTGKVRHQGVIKQMQACGVEELIVEVPSISVTRKPLRQKVEDKSAKALVSVANDAQHSSSEQVSADNDSPNDDFIELDDMPFEEQSQQTPAPVATAKRATPSAKQKASSSYEQAEQLVIECKKLHKQISVDLKKGMELDFSPAKTLVSDMYHQLLDKPEALLCLSMIRNEGEYISNHAMHTSILLCVFAQHLGMSQNDCQRLALLGYCFDIGMVKVPSSIINKQGKPTADEQAIIEKHVAHSLELLEPLALDKELRLAIEQHHERLDGSGYPNGLKGEQIHKFSRMLAIVDCYEAMTTNRPFQRKSSPAAALKLITNKDFGYDLKLALQFVRCIGVYPVGSLVILSNQHIAMVTQNHKGKALKPVVKSFYSISSTKYVQPKEINLADDNVGLTIVQPTLPEHYQIDMEKVEL